MASIYKIASGWRAQVRVKGKQVSGVFPTKAAAAAFAREQETTLHRSGSNDPYIRFSELVAAYRDNSTSPGSESKQRLIDRIEAYWGDWRVREIHSGSVSDYALKRQRDGLGPSTVMMELGYLAGILRHGGVLTGSDEALLAREKVASTITTLRHMGVAGSSQERTRRPTPEELDMLLRHFDTRPRSQVPMSDIVLFALTTACRVSEIAGRKGVMWEDYNPAERTIWVRDRKHPGVKMGNHSNIPLLRGPVTLRGNTIDPAEVIERQRERTGGKGQVFPYTADSVKNAFHMACLRLRLDDLHFHDLRHDAISRLFEFGLDIPRVALVSGHKTWKNLARYTHLKPSDLTR
jgi:integrase